MWWTRNNSNGSNPSRGQTSRLEVAADFQVPDEALLDLMNQDSALKIWLPQPVAHLIHDQAGRDGISQSAWLRDLLNEYTYGRLTLQALREKQRKPTSESTMLFAVDHRGVVDAGKLVYKIPALGKNTSAFKLWLSSTLRDDLQALAEHANLTISAFTREVIVSALLGHASLPQRPELYESVSEYALAWERDEAVPMTILSKQEFQKLVPEPSEYETEWVER